jgi:hypothetical protein
MNPARIETSLLVLEQFRDSAGTTWQPGDRAPLASRAVREAATQNPAWFVAEFSTEPFDPSADWFRELDESHERRYAELKRHRDGAEERRQRALREELRAQDTAQPELERRFKKQEAERAERAEKAREERERQQIEHEIAFYGGLGFHLHD